MRGNLPPFKTFLFLLSLISRHGRKRGSPQERGGALQDALRIVLCPHTVRELDMLGAWEILINIPAHSICMKPVSPLMALFAVLLLPAAHSLVYSTLEMEAMSQVGEPVEGVHFFLECKMSFSSVERYLCTSNLNGTCKSSCMDCAVNEGAQIRATYLNQTVLQEILAWEGNDTCKGFHEPYVSLGPFIFEVEEAVEEAPESDVEGAEENLPEDTNIETHDYYLGETEGDYEYTSYLDELEEEEGENGEGGDACIGAFILLCACASFLVYYPKNP
jgi:hypothetical protein